MAIDSSTKLGPGFRFHPTDEELVRFYLKRKVTGKLLRFDYIAVVDVYKFEPWDLPCKSKMKTRDLEWYFFSVLDRKYGNGSRTNRATERGYWKTTGKDRTVKHGERTVGMKKTLVYHQGRAPHGARTNWVMHEYKLVDEQLALAGVVQVFGAEKDAFVLCRVFEKSGAGPKNGEKYGAPLDEEEWDLDDEEEEEEEKVPEDGDYVEADDLDEKLDLSGIIRGSGFPSSNFFPGECSRQPEHSQVFIKDGEKPLADNLEISGPQNGQPSDVAGQYGVDTTVMGDNGELSQNGNFPNFDEVFGDQDLYFDVSDLDLSLDVDENLPFVDDGSFLETNDLGFQNEGNPTEADPTEADPSWNDMINEYLAYLDGDISKHINYDSPLNTESENSVLNQGSPFIQQNAEGVASKLEAQSSNAASSEQQNPPDSKLVSGDTNPFVKQANKWLASIPAAPAFASEFPTKEIALGLHPAAQSSNSAHITAGMISITDITFRGNAMDWTMGKNGGFNAIISAGFSQPNVNSAALMPVSGLVSSKTAFVLSHGWIFVMGFSVLVLSLSFKIGSIMYTGK